MKKIMALVLAAAMLTTTAFAATDIGIGGTSVSNPGEDLSVNYEDFEISTDIGYRFSSEYFTITAKKFTKGANLVKEIKFDDDASKLLIVLNDNYELSRPGADKAPNLVIDKLELKTKKAVKVDGVEVLKKNVTVKFDGSAKKNELRIGYEKNENELYDNAKFENGELVKFINADSQPSTPYATADMSEGDVYLEGRVYKNDKVFVEINNKVNKEILKASDDADIRFYNIKTNGFPSSTTINLTAEEDEFVYKIVDGKLSASGLKWSADDYAWTGKIRSSVSYVVSDVELKAAPATGETATGNPDTGANDVVGIAAALAVVSLVAAGAVSLKK